ncbi:MAG TPA: bifunctional molybdenum cofactor biosynthesis protein MoaC/MoaB, partial [Algoriphagus sp.]|nr:bifunctional molybdenum cofactor biosynthesis protein MoaC/MoaB [Algoriphagus sp.]
SDTISQGKGEDKSGKIIQDKLSSFGVQVAAYEIIPDEIEKIQGLAKKYADEGIDLIIFSGGTGLSPRDVTPDALESLLTRKIPGIEETIRNYGQQRVPTAFLSRSLAGVIDQSLVLALPGSSAGARESLDAVFPAVLHVFKVLSGERH